MAQVVPGLILGSPGGVGSAPLGHYYGSGAPTSSTNNIIVSAQVGSLYSDYVNGALYFKSVTGWQAVTIP
jgi:hypothetical protein